MTRLKLPDDVEELKTLVLQEHQRAELLDLKLKNLEARVLGRHASEKLHHEQASGQQVFEFVDLPHPPQEAPPAEPVYQPSQAPKGKGGRTKLPDHLQRVRREHTLAEEDRQCVECGEAMQPFGEEVSEQLARIPARTYVIQHARIKYACKACQSKPAIAEVPHKVIDKGLADAGLLAEIAVQKFADHLPLYRQEQIFARDGVNIPRSTQCAWMGVVSELLKPIVDWMKLDLLRSVKIHTDDTTVRVLDPGSHKTRTARLWVYVGDENHSHVVFEYTTSRHRDGPAKFLERYKGYLQADAYAGYDGIYASREIIEVACWAHMRRKFFEARDTDVRADELLLMVAELYAVEKQARELNLSAQLRQELRQLKTAPILTRIRTWLDARVLDTLPKSPLRQAVRYALNQWQALMRFIENGALEPDNNAAENALRPVTLGRKNYMFMGSDSGGRRAAILYSLIQSCKRHSVNPLQYLRDVLVRISTHPASLVHELAPAHWKPPAIMLLPM